MHLGVAAPVSATFTRDFKLRLSVDGPKVLDLHAVALFWAIGADGDQLQSLGTALESAHHVRRDANHVPFAQLDDLVIKAHPARAADDHVGLLLLVVLMAEAGAK